MQRRGDKWKATKIRVIVITQCICLGSSKWKNDTYVLKVRSRSSKDISYLRLPVQYYAPIEKTKPNQTKPLLHFTASGRRLACLVSGCEMPQPSRSQGLFSQIMISCTELDSSVLYTQLKQKALWITMIPWYLIWRQMSKWAEMLLSESSALIDGGSTEAALQAGSEEATVLPESPAVICEQNIAHAFTQEGSDISRFGKEGLYHFLILVVLSALFSKISSLSPLHKVIHLFIYSNHAFQILPHIGCQH